MKNTALFVQKSGHRGKFHPHLYFDKHCCLQVILRDCVTRGGIISSHFDVLKDVHSKVGQGTLAGFRLWGAYGVLYDQGYTKSSISLEHLIKRFARYHKLPYNTSVFGHYEKDILRIARKHQFVWHIPK